MDKGGDRGAEKQLGSGDTLYFVGHGEVALRVTLGVRHRKTCWLLAAVGEAVSGVSIGEEVRNSVRTCWF